MKTSKPYLRGWKSSGLILLVGASLAACSDDGAENTVDAELIVLQEGQSPSDVIGEGDTPEEQEPNEELVLTDSPESSGQPLFRNPENSEQILSGFEFCCGQYNTYAENGYGAITGDFDKLDGGFWGADVAGVVGERVFSSFSDGFTSDDEALGWIGFSAIGTMESPSFEITHQFINFLVGGGSNGVSEANTTALALVIDDEIVRQASGDDTEMSMRWVSWDVGDYIGTNAKIRFIDHHPDDNSDDALPYLLADELRVSDEAAAVPEIESKMLASANISVEPEVEGVPAFSRVSDPDQNIAGFEFCCGQFNTYANHDFRATGEMAKLDGGWWAADIVNHQGERIFTSRGDGFSADGTGLGWIGDEATGTLSSPPFDITHKFLNFLIGGGTNDFTHENATAVVLRVNGKVVRQAVGNGQESQVDWHTWDVSALQGETAVLEIVDQHLGDDDGSLPFIMLDEVRLADFAAIEPSQSDFVSMPDGHDVSLPLVMADPNPYFRDGTFYIYYLIDTAFHDWYLTKTNDLQSGSFPQRVLQATGDANTQDQWTGSGSVIEDVDGQTHIFFNGHNAEFNPVEAVMHAVATDNTLTDFAKVPEDTFTGSNGYSDFDFRDPEVFWNEDTGNYWMLITTRYNEQAAIGLYTSDNLATWTPQEPLFTLDTPLNLEVPDWVDFTDNAFILFSDQNDGERDVKHLVQSSSGWQLADYTSLDGEFFYAGRTASSEDATLMFGWIPHKVTRTNAGGGTFGGDLAIHQLVQTTSGELAVKMPDAYKTEFSEAVSTDVQEHEGGISEDSSISLMSSSAFTLEALGEKNRLSMNVSSENANGRFGLYFPTDEEAEQVARIEFDTNSNQASFYFGEVAPTGGASVTPTPALEGEPLFARTEEPEQNIAGFEFCCGQYNTLAGHEFTNITGDFVALDGGWWGGDIANNVGERVFSSFGDGFDENGNALGWIGYGATGSVDTPTFEITKPYINFLIGGGSNPFDNANANATAVVLIVNGEVVRSQSGRDAEKAADDKFLLEWATWDVSEFIGQTAVIRLIDLHSDDASDTALPYLIADEFRAADLPAVSDDEEVSAGNLDAHVSVPMDLAEGVKLDVWLDPKTGMGSAYINDFRALSFRLYDLEHRSVGVYTREQAISVNELQRFIKN
ncbi:hypothetical protein BM523_16445 [Alteromonas mediterranea]|uniref:hypothetical protein n=1 Tax=Alteromonas mediterranea TaxID=314275 RepID=UPI000903427D|nr:hypothetical protein [Alteromonas mediterranea]APD95454.1 hypothetical protein BM523_16445 [Alteromonas mediterranea]APD99088.1 hypothetical protein BM525_16465 [Alteromonas mediterranea]